MSGGPELGENVGVKDYESMLIGYCKAALQGVEGEGGGDYLSSVCSKVDKIKIHYHF